MRSRWLVNQRQAAERDLAEALALGRQDAKRRADADREREAIDRDARKVGSAIRKAERAARKMHFPVRAYPAFIEGRREGRVRIQRFEKALSLSLPRKPDGGKVSSFHFRFRGRGLGHHRSTKGYPFKRGETVRAIRYILRDSAREIPEGGIVSSISLCADEIASLFAALEELEFAAGRINAQVFWSLVISLPHELTSNQRLELLDEICTNYADLGLPFAAVLHSPDADGDERNYHAHVVGSWRPFRIGPDRSYSFSDKTLSLLNTREGIFEQRECAAAAMNRAMTAAGHERRFSPETNAKRGLPPVSKAAGKSSIGQKNRERKLRAIEAMKSERALKQERRSVLAKLRTDVAKLAEMATMELDNIIANLLTAERRIAEALAKPTSTASLAPASTNSIGRKGSDAVAFSGPAEPSPMLTSQPKDLATVSVAREAADAIAIDPSNVHDLPTDTKPSAVPIHTVKPNTPVDTLATARVHHRVAEANSVSREKPTQKGALNPQQTNPDKHLDRKNPDHADQTPSGSGIAGTGRAMPTGSPIADPGSTTKITSESAIAANDRGDRDQHTNPVDSESKVSSGTPSASSTQLNSNYFESTDDNDREAKQELPKPTQEQFRLMAAKIAERKKAKATGERSLNRVPNHIGELREIIQRHKRAKSDAVPATNTSSREVRSLSDDHAVRIDHTKEKVRHGFAEPEVPGEKIPTTIENVAKSQPEPFSAFWEIDDHRRRRRKKREVVSEIAKKTAEGGLAEGENPDTAASALQSDRTIDLALVAELFHSTAWDPREFGADGAGGRRPDRWSQTITEAEDLEYLNLLSAHTLRGGNSRS